MYKVKIYPSKCPNDLSWVQKEKEGSEIELSDFHYGIHSKHGCMKPIEHYRKVTLKKEKCKCCGSMVLHRKKIVIERFDKNG